MWNKWTLNLEPYQLKTYHWYQYTHFNFYSSFKPVHTWINIGFTQKMNKILSVSRRLLILENYIYYFFKYFIFYTYFIVLFIFFRLKIKEELYPPLFPVYSKVKIYDVIIYTVKVQMCNGRTCATEDVATEKCCFLFLKITVYMLLTINL